MSPKHSELPKNSRFGTFLLLVAWVLFIVSLFLPAIMPGEGRVRGTLGYEMLIATVIPLYWIVIYPFIYFLVNLSFILSPIGFQMRRLEGLIYTVAPICLTIGNLATFSCILWLEDLGTGYYCWVLSYLLMTIAFFLPLEDSGVEITEFVDFESDETGL